VSERAVELQSEAPQAKRFAFGENWSEFVELLTPSRIAEAEKSLREMLDTKDLRGKRFLDVGSGSGLFSLAAMRLDAARVFSFDFDSASVRTTTAVRDRYFPDTDRWHIERGDVLDTGYMSQLGEFDVVYAWGVLHHTGDMATALERTAERVAPGGQLFIAIYDDQGSRSDAWRRVKRTYNRLPSPLRPLFVAIAMAPFELRAALRAALALSPRQYLETWTRYETQRGMHKWLDMVDWVGGYPFEVAKPEEIFRFHYRRGFLLTQLVTRRGGCNEYVFTRPAANCETTRNV
jgi:2-polyprenyl-3-methyl-5-hydroxy-6-metoxy-1,4-benzoquinol methylase